MMEGPTELINKRAELLDNWNSLSRVKQDSLKAYGHALAKGNLVMMNEADKVVKLADLRMVELEVKIGELANQIQAMIGEYFDTD